LGEHFLAGKAVGCLASSRRVHWIVGAALRRGMFMRNPVIVQAVLVWAVSAGSAGAEADGVPRVAFFGFDLINTSLEPENPLEDRRRQMLNDLFREKLNASGHFKIVTILPDMQKEIADGPAIRNCNGCQRDFAKRIGADLAAWGTVQKVSNLILNINVYMEDAQTGKLNFLKSVDIRGNTDESWRHGLDYMLRNYLLVRPH
jgi:hypothetical protein